MFNSLILICWAYKSTLNQFRLFQKNDWRNSQKRMKNGTRVWGRFSVLTSGILSSWFLPIYVFTCWAFLLVLHVPVLLCLHCYPSRKVSSECLILSKQNHMNFGFKNVLVFIETTLSNCIMSYMYVSSLS